jgi:hypothetical protein
MPETIVARCARCGQDLPCVPAAGILLCADCIDLILKEWQVKRDEYAAHS